MNITSIIFLICWQGNYPWYFPYFLHSCRSNPAIDFLIFTDNKSTLELSPNVKIMRELFKQSKDYRKVFTDSRNFFFDETNFAFEAFAKGLHYSQIHTEVESMTHVVRRLQEENRLKAYFEFQIVEGFAGNMLWNKGQLIYRKQFEAMLYHLVRFKRKYSEPVDLQRKIPDKFRIGKKKIYC